MIEFLYAGQGIGRPFVAPPDFRPDRLKMLRDAFNATMKDREFIADVARQKLDLEPEDGEHSVPDRGEFTPRRSPLWARSANSSNNSADLPTAFLPTAFLPQAFLQPGGEPPYLEHPDGAGGQTG